MKPGPMLNIDCWLVCYFKQYLGERNEISQMMSVPILLIWSQLGERDGSEGRDLELTSWAHIRRQLSLWFDRDMEENSLDYKILGGRTLLDGCILSGKSSLNVHWSFLILIFYKNILTEQPTQSIRATTNYLQRAVVEPSYCFVLSF